MKCPKSAREGVKLVQAVGRTSDIYKSGIDPRKAFLFSRTSKSLLDPIYLTHDPVSKRLLFDSVRSHIILKRHSTTIDKATLPPYAIIIIIRVRVIADLGTVDDAGPCTFELHDIWARK